VLLSTQHPLSEKVGTNFSDKRLSPRSLLFLSVYYTYYIFCCVVMLRCVILCNIMYRYVVLCYVCCVELRHITFCCVPSCYFMFRYVALC
jgi:hypothetical protein